MQHCHITDKTWNPRPLPHAYGEIAENYANAGETRHLADGWRVAVPYVDEPGYRHDSAKSTVMFGDTHATEMPGALINIADEQAAADAAQAAAELLRLATPVVFDQPIQGRFETPATDGHIYGVEVDPVGGELIPVQRESTRLTQAEYEAARAAKLAERATHRATMAAIKTDLDQVAAALDQVDVTTTGPLGLAITATTGVNKTALTEVRKVLVDLKAATTNLKQASEKVRREIR